MLDKFKKLLGNAEANPAAKKEEMTITIDTSDVKAELEKMQAEFESFKSEANGVAALQDEKIAELKAALNKANEVIAAAEAEKAEMAAKALAAKLDARKEKVVAAIGTEKAEGFMAATEGLDDAAFEAVVSALAGSVEVEANSELFKEVGVTAEVDAAKVVEGSSVGEILKAKYKQN